MLRVRSGWKTWSGAVATALLVPSIALAQSADPERWQLNMGRGVTQSSENAYSAHMVALWICVGIGVIVFAAMAYAMFKFRKSKGAVPDVNFTHSTVLELIWTVVPVALLVLMAFPATDKLMKMYDTRDAAMTVKITAYQWLWKYEYPGDKPGEAVVFTSRLDRKSDDIRQSKVDARTANHPTYLLDVDNALVVPVNTKIHFLITADDVIHSWWVPALGWKQDAIPGLVNEAWTEIKTPGVYRGQCAELCGKDHGFMPIVVKALPQADFDRWLAAERAKNAPPAAAPAPDETAPIEAAPTEAAAAATADASQNAAPADAAPAAAKTAG
ncbi:MAG: cytochrome c oxidase subunit II [Xanthomonadaceae bacterium]|nr:cytochrome c oxidase subunit II [Xanthomonadaceae bacterium]